MLGGTGLPITRPSTQRFRAINRRTRRPPSSFRSICQRSICSSPISYRIYTRIDHKHHGEIQKENERWIYRLFQDGWFMDIILRTKINRKKEITIFLLTSCFQENRDWKFVYALSVIIGNAWTIPALNSIYSRNDLIIVRSTIFVFHSHCNIWRMERNGWKSDDREQLTRLFT